VTFSLLLLLQGGRHFPDLPWSLREVRRAVVLLLLKRKRYTGPGAAAAAVDYWRRDAAAIYKPVCVYK
jgi:hypothetical protein